MCLFSRLDLENHPPTEGYKIFRIQDDKLAPLSHDLKASYSVSTRNVTNPYLLKPVLLLDATKEEYYHPGYHFYSIREPIEAWKLALSAPYYKNVHSSRPYRPLRAVAYRIEVQDVYLKGIELSGWPAYNCCSFDIKELIWDSNVL